MGTFVPNIPAEQKEMLEKGRKVPVSFIVISACELVFLLVCWLITVFYFPIS